MPSQQNFIFSARANFQMRQGLPRGALPPPRPSSRQDAIPSGSGMKHEGFHSWGVSEGKGGGSDSNSPVRRKLLVGRIPLAPSPGLDLNPELPEAAVSPQQPPHRAAKMGGVHREVGASRAEVPNPPKDSGTQGQHGDISIPLPQPGQDLLQDSRQGFCRVRSRRVGERGSTATGRRNSWSQGAARARSRARAGRGGDPLLTSTWMEGGRETLPRAPPEQPNHLASACNSVKG